MESLRGWVTDSIDLERSTGGVVVEGYGLWGIVEECPCKENQIKFVFYIAVLNAGGYIMLTIIRSVETDLSSDS